MVEKFLLELWSYWIEFWGVNVGPLALIVIIAFGSIGMMCYLAKDIIS